jgi:hypothetical protein
MGIEQFRDRGGVTSAEFTPHGVDLYWIPLGAGARSIKFNGIMYEATLAALNRRPRFDLYHSVLALDLPNGRHMVEMTPVPRGAADRRGVIAEGAVGSQALRLLRPFRYEVRRWRDGVVPDLDYAVESPIRITDDLATAQHMFDLLPSVPTLVWGRDELRTGDIWTCNSVISWVLTKAGVDFHEVPLPSKGRAPGWEAGHTAAIQSHGAALHRTRIGSDLDAIRRHAADTVNRSSRRSGSGARC